MKLHNDTAEIFIPDGQPIAEALPRITRLGIGAHQDDLEFMAFHGILAGYQGDSGYFGGVTCTNGNSSARTGPYADFTDAEMIKTRRQEQKAAAILGRYGVMIQLDYASRDVRGPSTNTLRDDLKQILMATRPQIVYTHNPADKHETHVGVVIAALQAMRELPRDKRPEKVWGCEVWRDLDWLPDPDKVLMDVSGHENLATALNGVFDSQIAGGKRYDLATLGRRRANATFFEAHAIDKATQLIFGMDLTPLVADETSDIVAYVGDLIGKFRNDVEQKLREQLGH
jgi:LmbE family N-acetylglucosaminyl deacetylase